MRQLILLFFFTSLYGYSQITTEISKLPDYMIPHVGVIHTIKIEIVNNDEKNRQIFLHNDESLTGIDFSESDLTDPVALLAEYGGMIDVDLDSWMPSPFGVWFKNMGPGTKFTFYFQSARHIDTERLLDLIRISRNDFSFKTQAIDDLGWKADEIVIYIPVRQP